MKYRKGENETKYRKLEPVDQFFRSITQSTRLDARITNMPMVFQQTQK